MSSIVRGNRLVSRCVWLSRSLALLTRWKVVRRVQLKPCSLPTRLATIPAGSRIVLKGTHDGQRFTEGVLRDGGSFLLQRRRGVFIASTEEHSHRQRVPRTQLRRRARRYARQYVRWPEGHEGADGKTRYGPAPQLRSRTYYLECVCAPTLDKAVRAGDGRRRPAPDGCGRLRLRRRTCAAGA
jgi:hypothetical protein